MFRNLAIVVLGIILIGFAGCTSLKTPEIKGVVLDAETGKPVANAIVFTGWQKIYSGPGGLSPGAVIKKVDLKTDTSGKFRIPSRWLINFVPWPFGQGGSFGIVVYTHGYQYKSFYFHESSEFKFPKYEEFAEINRGKEVIIKLYKLEDNPEAFLKNKSDIYSYIKDDNEYLEEEDKLFVKKYGKQKWNKNIQYELAEAYYRLGDYSSALRKLEEIIKRNPNARTKYFDEKYIKYKSKIKKSE